MEPADLLCSRNGWKETRSERPSSPASFLCPLRQLLTILNAMLKSRTP